MLSIYKAAVNKQLRAERARPRPQEVLDHEQSILASRRAMADHQTISAAHAGPFGESAIAR